MHTIFRQRPTPRSAAAIAPAGALLSPAALWRRLDRMLAAWHARNRQRFALSKLDDRLLRDIGVSRRDAEREARKPFWRA